eukprot:220467_1
MCFKSACDTRKRKSTNSESDCFCSICLRDLDGYAETCTLPNCGHTFHNQCIKQRYKMQTGNVKSCPLCRSPKRNESTCPFGDNFSNCGCMTFMGYVYNTLLFLRWLINLYFSNLGYQADQLLMNQDCVITNYKNLDVYQQERRDEEGYYQVISVIRTINASCPNTNSSIQVHGIWYYNLADAELNAFVLKRIESGELDRILFRAVTLKSITNGALSQGWLHYDQPRPGWDIWNPRFDFGNVNYTQRVICSIIFVLLHVMVMTPAVFKGLHDCDVYIVFFTVTGVIISTFSCILCSESMQKEILWDVRHAL